MKPFLVAVLLSAFVGGSQADGCGTPPALENGAYDVSSYTVGSWTYYTCNKGYILYGRNRKLCTKNGWTNGDLYCQSTVTVHSTAENMERLSDLDPSNSMDERRNPSSIQKHEMKGTVTVHSTTENMERLSHPNPSFSLDERQNPSSIQKHEMNVTLGWTTGPAAVYRGAENMERLSDLDSSFSLDEKWDPSSAQKHEEKGTSRLATVSGTSIGVMVAGISIAAVTTSLAISLAINRCMKQGSYHIQG